MVFNKNCHILSSVVRIPINDKHFKTALSCALDFPTTDHQIKQSYVSNVYNFCTTLKSVEITLKGLKRAVNQFSECLRD